MSRSYEPKKRQPAPPAVRDVIAAPGRPLEAEERRDLEPRFEHDFGDVRVHTDERAAASARAIGAVAYTVGTHVVFDRGFAPGTEMGRRLLAHELAHVVQQGEAPIGPQLVLEPADTRLEGEAQRAGGGGSPTLSRAPAATVQRQMGELRLVEARLEAEARLPHRFPDRGIRIVGADADALVTLLAGCTGLALERDAAQTLVERPQPQGQPPATGISRTATTTLRSFIRESRVGIVIDTDPHVEGVVLGTFAMATPGYHRLEVPNIRRLAAAGGESGGASACDVALHEIAEAFAGRRLSLERREVGRRAYEPAHEEGLRVEEGIRRDLGLPLRSRTEHGDFQQLGQDSPTSYIFLESIFYGAGRELRTQLNLLRVTITAAGTGDTEVVASFVVRGSIRFTTQREALEVFNRFASGLGFQPIPIPEGLK